MAVDSHDANGVLFHSLVDSPLDRSRCACLGEWLAFYPGGVCRKTKVDLMFASPEVLMIDPEAGGEPV